MQIQVFSTVALYWHTWLQTCRVCSLLSCFMFKQILNMETECFIFHLRQIFNTLWSKWVKKFMWVFMWNNHFCLQYQISWQSIESYSYSFTDTHTRHFNHHNSLYFWMWFWRNSICSSKRDLLRFFWLTGHWWTNSYATISRGQSGVCSWHQKCLHGEQHIVQLVHYLMHDLLQLLPSKRCLSPNCCRNPRAVNYTSTHALKPTQLLVLHDRHYFRRSQMQVTPFWWT